MTPNAIIGYKPSRCKCNQYRTYVVGALSDLIMIMQNCVPLQTAFDNGKLTATTNRLIWRNQKDTVRVLFTSDNEKCILKILLLPFTSLYIAWWQAFAGISLAPSGGLQTHRPTFHPPLTLT